MIRKSRLVFVVSVFVVAMILAAAPFYATHSKSTGKWPEGSLSESHRPHSDSPRPSDSVASPPHNWNPEESSKDLTAGPPANDTPVYRHSGVPVGILPKLEARVRYEAAEVWRDENEVMPIDENMVALREPRERPVAKPQHKFRHKAEWKEQQIIADFPDHPLVDETFVMIKTGSQTQWARMPWHTWTTFTRIKHFALYSDQPGSVAGYEIIDILANMRKKFTDEIPEFNRYNLAHQMAEERWNWEGGELSSDGGWHLDKYKNMPMLHHAYKTMPDAKWYFFMDDDTFVFWENLYHLLDQYDSAKPWYLGAPATKDPPYIFAHGGSGVVLSQGAMKILFDHSDKQNEKFLERYARVARRVCCGDYVVAEALGKKGVLLDTLGYDELEMTGGPFHKHNIWAYIFVPGRFSARPISFHHLNSHQGELLYEYEKLRCNSGPVSAAELYRDFVLPYISEERKNWISARADLSYMAEMKLFGDPERNTDKSVMDGEIEFYPWKTKETCRRACELDEQCWQWSHTTELCILTYKGLTLGKAVNPYRTRLTSDEEKGTFYTGWMIDKIRERRAQDKNDPLEYDPETNSWNDDENTSEGWYLRKLKDASYQPYDRDVAAF